MTPAARIAAAIEVLGDIETRRRPAAEALKDWGLGHRFAGSKDRSAIASLVYDALRVRASAAWIMGEDTPRAIMLGALKRGRGMETQAIAALCGAGPHAPPELTDAERQRLDADDLTGAPDHVQGDYPEWLAEAFQAAFGDRAVAEGRALAERAPVDLRANLLKITRDKALATLAHLNAQATTLSPWGLRIAVGADGRGPALSAEPAYAKGQVEVQDEASQLAALIAGAKPGWQVLDLCAGAGGKSLALAAMMENKGQVFATDSDGRRLMPIYDRLERAGARNVQVRAPKAGKIDLADLEERCDLVFVDAPCTGTGTWRRNPDAKWRTRPGALEQRQKQQDEVLQQAARYVKAGGRLVYVTCSVLREENEARVANFLENSDGFLPLDAAHIARGVGIEALAEHASPHGAGLRLSPASAGTDGFYIAVMLRV
ncbi:MAG: MFS transporter [Rhizobiales bacterium 62-17]|nr:RsmB/NOP family class I SAM-dependent RNA methyltransferase [Hyphomicrobiales bacterium]OJY04246.1 MAG: MFS transporter [Rhizobiales bacterium 62-17]